MSAWYIYKDIFEECISQFEFAKKLMSGKILIYAKDESFSYHGSKILFDAGAEEVITWSKINQKNVLTKRMYADSKSIIVSNISENHLNDDYFDNIISLNTIQNTEPEFLVSCKKLLKNNGLFFISIQNSLVYPSSSKNISLVVSPLILNPVEAITPPVPDSWPECGLYIALLNCMI